MSNLFKKEIDLASNENTTVTFDIDSSQTEGFTTCVCSLTFADATATADGTTVTIYNSLSREGLDSGNQTDIIADINTTPFTAYAFATHGADGYLQDDVTTPILGNIRGRVTVPSGADAGSVIFNLKFI